MSSGAAPRRRMKYTLACGIPSLAKLESVTGSRVRSWNNPRSRGPSVRAVISPVPTPSSVIPTWAPKTPSDACTRRRPFWLAMRRFSRNVRSGGTAQGIEAEPPGTEHRRAVVRKQLAPEPCHARLEGVPRRVEALDVDRHVRHPEQARPPREGFGRVEDPVVDQPLLEVAGEKKRPVDVVRVRDLLEHEHAAPGWNCLVGTFPEDEPIRMAPQERLGRETPERHARLVRPERQQEATRHDDVR